MRKQYLLKNLQIIDVVIKGGEVYTQDEILKHIPDPIDTLERDKTFIEKFEKSMGIQ